MERISIIKFKTFDKKEYDNESEAIQHEKELCEKYANDILENIKDKETLNALYSVINRNVSNTQCFAYQLNLELRIKLFALLDGDF